MATNKAMLGMNDVPNGTSAKIKKTGEEVKIMDVLNFPTRYRCDDGNIYYTSQITFLNWPPEKEIDSPE